MDAFPLIALILVALAAGTAFYLLLVRANGRRERRRSGEDDERQALLAGLGLDDAAGERAPSADDPAARGTRLDRPRPADRGAQEAGRTGLRAVLAASDLSQASDAALVSAAAVAEFYGAELHVHHCVPKPVFPYWRGAIDSATRQVWIERAEAALQDQLRRSLPDTGSAVRLSVSVGEPVQEITRRAAGVAADLIVVGPHQPRGALGDLLGSTADRLIRTASLPCLIAHRPMQLPMRRVLFPTDFSRPALHATRVGLQLIGASTDAQEPAGAATIVELLFVSAFAAPSHAPLAVQESLAAQLEAAREQLEPGAAVQLRSSVVSAPLPVDGIRDAAEQLPADLIVMGTHGYGTLGRALIGSVASAVARTVPVPLVLVPPPAG